MKLLKKKLMLAAMVLTLGMGTAILAKASAQTYKEVIKGNLENGKAIEIEAVLNGYIGTLEVELPMIQYSEDYTETTVKTEKVLVEVVREQKGQPQITYKVLKGQEGITFAESYVGGYEYGYGDIYIEEGADTSKLPQGYYPTAQVGGGTGNAAEAGITYFVSGLVDSYMQYYTADGTPYAYVTLDQILIITEEEEESFLKTGKLNEYDTYEWPGLKELLSGMEQQSTVNSTDSKNVTAQKASVSVMVNGKETPFEAYTINNSNYFKLRDLAYVVNETEKQFSVGWDESNKAMTLTSGQSYKILGNEMAVSGSNSQVKAVVNSAKVYVDDKEKAFTAYTINNNTYFKLRDIAQVFNIGIGWNQDLQSISIDTAVDYIEE